jgi:hypothetical protein
MRTMKTLLAGFLGILILFLASCKKEAPPLPIPLTGSKIIADHTIVDKFDKIPQQYINEIKKMLVIIAGESHSWAYVDGMLKLEQIDETYQVDFDGVDKPPAYTDKRLRIERVTWGDYSNPKGWIRSYGEEDWFTNPTAISRTKAGITYMNTNGYEITAIGFAWCWDMVGDATPTTDPVYGVRWFGASIDGPDGDKPWGLDAEDYAITENSVSMDSYLSATQDYVNYCTVNGYPTKVFFTTGPVDVYGSEEARYQAYIKHEFIRDYAASDSTRILFDYADILCYNNNGSISTLTWNGHTFPTIHSDNMEGNPTGHIGPEGALRLTHSSIASIKKGCHFKTPSNLLAK